MKGYSWSREDYIELLYNKFYNMDYTRMDPGCLTLSEDMMDARDFKAEEAIKLDTTITLPKAYSLGKRIYKTNYQNGWGSCTANATSHCVQILAVRDKGVEPTKDNIITPDWKNLWTNMGHDLKNQDDSGDYVETAINTARKMGIKTEEETLATFDGYSYGTWTANEKGIETIKRYIYNENPIDWCFRGNDTTWNEITKGQLKTFIPVGQRTGGHAVTCVGWDEGGLWFINSWRTNDGKGRKSRFYVTYSDMIKCSGMFNWRYRPLYKKFQAKKDPEYLKRKGNALVAIQALKKIYPEEKPAIQKLIENISKELRVEYPELNEEQPI